MNTLAHSPWTPVLALDRLNSWVRSREPWCCPIRALLKPVVYWTKTKAILDLSRRWHIGLRRVMVRKACRVCGGDGIYRSPYCYSGDDVYDEPCRTCGATGTVTLKFVESTIGPVRWHTPAKTWYSSGLDVYLPFPSHAYAAAAETERVYELATDWEPNQPGRRLTFAEIERDIVLVLHAWPEEVTFAIDCHHFRQRAQFRRNWHAPDIRGTEEWLRKRIAMEVALHG